MVDDYQGHNMLIFKKNQILSDQRLSVVGYFVGRTPVLKTIPMPLAVRLEVDFSGQATGRD